MYKLIKITNSGCNVPEPVRFTLTHSASCERGMPFFVDDGILLPVSSSTNRLPTHITILPLNGDKEVLCYEVTPHMIFSVKTSAPIEFMNVGAEYLLSDNGHTITSTKVTGSQRGAVLISKNGAKELGDEVLVAFR